MQTILFQGDSITDAIRLRDRDEYRGCGYATMVTARLTSEKPGEYRCLNRGVSGDRISNILNRMRCDIEQLKPDVMSLLIGVNDVWHEVSEGDGVPAERFERMLDLLLTELEGSMPDLKIMLLEPFVLEGAATCDIPERPHRWDTFRLGVPLRARAVERMAAKHGCVYVPLQQRFTELGERYGNDCWLIDGVHPTAAGHLMITDAWLEGFAKLR